MNYLEQSLRWGTELPGHIEYVESQLYYDVKDNIGAEFAWDGLFHAPVLRMNWDFGL
jgi:hypothetical protein